MKRIPGIFLATLLIFSIFSPVIVVSVVNAQSENQWPDFDVNGDSEIDIADSIQYLKDHFVSYDDQSEYFYWSFADSADHSMANYFIRSVREVEHIRNDNDDMSVFKFIDKLLRKPGCENGLGLTNFDDTPITVKDVPSLVYFTVKNWLGNPELLTKAFDALFDAENLIALLLKAGLTVEEIGTFKETLTIFLLEEGEAWLLQLEQQVNWVTLRTIDSSKAKYPILTKVSKYFTVAIAIYDLVNIACEHIMNIIEIGSANIMESVKQYEIWQVEVFRMIIGLVGKIAMAVGESVLQPHFIHGLVTVCASLATFGGPPGIVAAAVVGVAGVVFYFTVKDIVEKALDFAEDETLGLDLALYKKLSNEPKPIAGVSPWRLRVTILDENYDNFIPWGDGYDGERVTVRVKNTGEKTLNVRVEPTKVAEGWQVDDNELDFDNWKEEIGIEPGRERAVGTGFLVKSAVFDNKWTPWDPSDDEWIPGTNPGEITFTFNHDVRTEWWDFFDFMGLKFLGEKTQVYYNNVEAYIVVNSGLPPQKGTLFDGTVEITNKAAGQISFSLGVSLKDPLGESKKYDPQINISPTAEVTLATDQTQAFDLKWLVPLDVPTGFYQIAVNCWKSSGERYSDNLEWKTAFFVYDLEIITPTGDHPAEAGDPSDPNPIFIYLTGLPPLEDDPSFTVLVGGAFATGLEIVDRLPVPMGYTLRVLPPTRPAEGVYDLAAGASFGSLGSLAEQQSAVEYTLAPSTGPVEKGLAWLRTSQYSDGSWRSSVGVTALCVLAFLNAGYDETDPDVNQAIQYILSKVHPDGSIYVASGSKEYETSLAVLALVATYNDAHTTEIDNARNWLVNSQWDESCLWGSVNKDSWYYGGFGYGYSVRPDLSNTQFVALALDAAGLPKDDPAWTKLQVFLHRCQRVDFPITLTIDGQAYTVQPYNSGGFDGGFGYTPGSDSWGSMTGAGIWGLMLSGVPKNDPRVARAIDWVVNHYTWETNPGPGSRAYYYYLSMAKALTMYGEKVVGGHDWYQDLYNKITNPGEMILEGDDKAKWIPSGYEDYVPDLPTAYAILSLQTRAAAPPVQRLLYLTFILRSNSLIRILDPEGNLVGYNYVTGLGENNLSTAIYSGPLFEPQHVVIVNPKLGTYKLELLGTSEGPYELTIQGRYGEVVTDTFQFAGSISQAMLVTSDVDVTSIVGPIDIYADPPSFKGLVQVKATVETHNNALNLKASGERLIFHIELPDGQLTVNDITISSISLNSTILLEPDTLPEVGDHDNDGIPDLKLTFRRSEIAAYLTSAGIDQGEVSFTLTGRFKRFTAFQGTITIHVSPLSGDVNCDAKVDIFDVVLAATSYCSKEGDTTWNPNANFAKQWSIIDIFDLITIASHFGEEYP